SMSFIAASISALSSGLRSEVEAKFSGAFIVCARNRDEVGRINRTPAGRHLTVRREGSVGWERGMGNRDWAKGAEG
ncbi:MAG: hypothetical protein ACK5SZ_01095, partial [bacterium]